MSEILEHLYASEFADFLMAPLDANQWFQFVGRHLRRHHRPIERLRMMEGFPE
jgi:hypothetical protein